eukprot:jgi/Mesvir1/24322/Mv11006-RA.1
MGTEHTHSHHCNCNVAPSGLEQSFAEVEFSRSLGAAAVDGDLDKLKRKIAAGADVNERSAGGYTPLLYASRGGHLPAVSLLLQHGADVHACTSAGRSSALHRAAAAGHVDVVRRLLQAGASDSAQDADGMTPLHRAAAANQVECFRALWEQGGAQVASARDDKASSFPSVPSLPGPASPPPILNGTRRPSEEVLGPGFPSNPF